MHLVDRRLNPKGKSLVDVQRFFDRVKKDIRNSIDYSLNHSTIKDAADDSGVTTKNVISVLESTIHEPKFRFDHEKGKFSFILPGNKNIEQDSIGYKDFSSIPSIISSYIEGDIIYKPSNNSAKGSKGGSDGDTSDDFVFVLSQEEYAKLFLEDLELPNQEEKILDSDINVFHKAGYNVSGSPANLSLLRTLRNSYGRRIGLKRPKLEELEELERKLDNLVVECTETGAKERQELELKIKEMRTRMETIPYIDPFDVRYHNFVAEPTPKFQAVMFCLMDCSGSMTQEHKDLAKRFYILLYRFLKMKYNKVDIVFIRHTHIAKEVDENTFFYSKESGGTVVSSAFSLMREIIKNRYNPVDWNIYVAQASDGDNWEDNNNALIDEINYVLPIIQHLAYIEIKPDSNSYGFYPGYSDIWKLYEKIIPTTKKMALKTVTKRSEIYPVFRSLFAKKD